MKNLIKIFALLFVNFMFSQNVILNRVENTGKNTDKFFYKINPDSVKAEYLGEIEIQGFSKDDPAVFDLIYKKAKTIGANAFSYKPFATIDGISEKLDPSHYLLSLYEVKKENLPNDYKKLYVFSSSEKPQKIAINENVIELPSRSFVLQQLLPGEIYTISTRKFLGSSVKITADKSENGQYLQISAFKINANPYGKAGINIKSGDILMLEKSYADFLSTIYKEIKK